MEHGRIQSSSVGRLVCPAQYFILQISLTTFPCYMPNATKYITKLDKRIPKSKTEQLVDNESGLQFIRRASYGRIYKGPTTRCVFSCNVARNSCRSRIEFHFSDVARNKLHRVRLPKKVLLYRASSPHGR